MGSVMDAKSEMLRKGGSDVGKQPSRRLKRVRTPSHLTKRLKPHFAYQSRQFGIPTDAIRNIDKE